MIDIKLCIFHSVYTNRNNSSPIYKTGETIFCYISYRAFDGRNLDSIANVAEVKK